MSRVTFVTGHNNTPLFTASAQEVPAKGDQIRYEGHTYTVRSRWWTYEDDRWTLSVERWS